MKDMKDMKAKYHTFGSFPFTRGIYVNLPSYPSSFIIGLLVIVNDERSASDVDHD
jgi:hypothetical protein